ncbi:hypothetical protein, partial [Catellatospora sp. NPDC049609]|uniref:hypothetical protein n=1 Tax=Catellatospora sp. NPDC049609 TaxID=3155505 RepID=UPI00342DF3BD
FLTTPDLDYTNPTTANLYTYTANNPIGMIDPTGLSGEPIGDGGESTNPCPEICVPDPVSEPNPPQVPDYETPPAPNLDNPNDPYQAILDHADKAEARGPLNLDGHHADWDTVPDRYVDANTGTWTTGTRGDYQFSVFHFAANESASAMGVPRTRIRIPFGRGYGIQSAPGGRGGPSGIGGGIGRGGVGGSGTRAWTFPAGYTKRERDKAKRAGGIVGLTYDRESGPGALAEELRQLPRLPQPLAAERAKAAAEAAFSRGGGATIDTFRVGANLVVPGTRGLRTPVFIVTPNGDTYYAKADLDYSHGGTIPEVILDDPTRWK